MQEIFVFEAVGHNCIQNAVAGEIAQDHTERRGFVHSLARIGKAAAAVVEPDGVGVGKPITVFGIYTSLSQNSAHVPSNFDIRHIAG